MVRSAETLSSLSTCFAAASLPLGWAFARDLFLFKRLFLDGRIYDPVTADLLEAWRDLLFPG